MKIMSTRVHGVMDYLVGILLIAAPWLLDFANNGAETWVPVVIGAATIIYSLLTNYELGVMRVIPFKAHLTIDILSGVLLAASPWLFGFSDEVYLPHVIVGLLELAVVAVSETEPGRVQRHDTRHHHA